MKISPEALAEIHAHAITELPNEACGLLVRESGNSDMRYVPCRNYAASPDRDFQLSTEVFLDWQERGTVLAVVHSHPSGQKWPSAADMRSQIDTDVPWIIVPVDKGYCGPATIWGDQLPIAPLLGREFISGVFDCYSLIRDVFRTGRAELKTQGMEWPFAPIELPQVPRDDDWWSHGQNLYSDALQPNGFRQITFAEARPGDGFLLKIRSDVLNHAGLLVGDNLILHHLPGRLSRREPAGLWGRGAEMWVRYEGPGS